MATPRNGTSQWQMWSSIAAGAIAFLGFIGTVSYQVVGVAVQQSIQAERNSTYERRLDALRADVEAQKLENTRQRAALIEIETQFCASDAARNLMHANDLRMYAQVYEKVFGQSFHIGNAYYPQICNRLSQGQRGLP